MSVSQPTPDLGCLLRGNAAGSDLRPLAAFLDLCLPLDAECQVLSLTPAPEPDLDAALEVAISDRIATLVETGREDLARRLYGDQEIDDWFRAQGWNPDAARAEMCERCHTRPVKHTRTGYCEGCSELMLDIAASQRYFDGVNGYGCEGEAA